MKVLIVVNDDFSAWHFRKGLITELVKCGADVVVATPDGPYVEKIISLKARHCIIPMRRFISPLHDAALLIRLYLLFRRERPDIVHTMTVKPNTIGAFAALLARVPKTVGLVSGLGSVFGDTAGMRARLSRWIVSRMYRLAGRIHAKIWFQNADDLALFVKLRLLDPSKGVVIRGSGVDLDAYHQGCVPLREVRDLREELGIPSDEQVVLMMVARLTWSKGVGEFVEACERVQEQGMGAFFVLVGPLDPSEPDAVDEDFLADAQRRSSRFLRLGFRNDVQRLLSLADVVVLPSWYREGVPRVLLEAMAMGKPIVTTDNVGCRETVEDGENGFLVPIRDAAALADAIIALLRDRALRERFGRRSRAKVEAEFDEKLVVHRVLKELYQLDPGE